MFSFRAIKVFCASGSSVADLTPFPYFQHFTVICLLQVQPLLSIIIFRIYFGGTYAGVTTRSWEFYTRLDAQLMPFFEKKIRQTYAVPIDLEMQLRYTTEFISTAYYRFWGNALTGSPCGSVKQRKFVLASAMLVWDSCLKRK